MDTKKLQDSVNNTFRENFGYTPLNERLKDIQNEFFELMKWTDVNNLKEETGDLLSSVIQLCNENGWTIDELIDNNIKKIQSRTLQYKTLGRKVKVAILGGAFNPIHNDHIRSAQFILNTSGVFDEVWLSPCYKHMYHKEMVSAEHRLKMCELAAKVDGRIKVFDYEIKNQLSGETYNFVKRLKNETELTEKYKFSMIIGLDNANTFNKWVNYEELERLISFVVIPRKGCIRDEKVDWYLKYPHIYLNNETNDIGDISSTFIRNYLKYFDGDLDNLKTLINKDVINYIISNNLYENQI